MKPTRTRTQLRRHTSVCLCACVCLLVDSALGVLTQHVSRPSHRVRKSKTTAQDGVPSEAVQVVTGETIGQDL